MSSVLISFGPYGAIQGANNAKIIHIITRVKPMNNSFFDVNFPMKLVHDRLIDLFISHPGIKNPIQ